MQGYASACVFQSSMKWEVHYDHPTSSFRFSTPPGFFPNDFSRRLPSMGFPGGFKPLFLTGIFGWWWLQTPEACCGKRRDSNPGGPKPPIFRAGRSPIIVKSRLLLLVKHHLFWVLKLNKSQFLKRTRLGPRVSLKFLVWKQSSPKFGG